MSTRTMVEWMFNASIAIVGTGLIILGLWLWCAVERNRAMTQPLWPGQPSADLIPSRAGGANEIVVRMKDGYVRLRWDEASAAWVEVTNVTGGAK